MEEIFIFEIKHLNIHSNNLFTHFQPLYTTGTHSLFSYEALIRCKGNISPEELFSKAREESKVNVLDQFSIKNAIDTFSKSHHLDVLLFLNVLPSTLLQDDFLPFLEDVLETTGYTKNRLVFELSETVSEAQHWGELRIKEVVSTLRKHDIQIAIDDVGSGIACNQKIIEIEPEFVKIDRYFGMGLSSSKLKQLTVQSYSMLCKGNSTLILEGIETKEDFELAKQLGVDVAQGYFLGKPNSLLKTI